MSNAFTLVEATVCLVLVASLAAIAAVNLRSGRGQAGLEGAIVQLRSADRLMRDRAARLGHPGELLFDLNAGSVARIEYDVDGRARRVPLEAFGRSARVKAVRATVSDIEDGRCRVRCVGGRTPTYAVLLASQSKEQWLIVPGLSGAFETAKDEAEVAKIFSDLRTAAGDDAR